MESNTAMHLPAAALLQAFRVVFLPRHLPLCCLLGSLCAMLSRSFLVAALALIMLLQPASACCCGSSKGNFRPPAKYWAAGISTSLTMVYPRLCCPLLCMHVCATHTTHCMPPNSSSIAYLVGTAGDYCSSLGGEICMDCHPPCAGACRARGGGTQQQA